MSSLTFQMRAIGPLVLFVFALSVSCQSGKFFFLSDVHLDPYYNPELTPDTYCQNQTAIILNPNIPQSYYDQRDNGIFKSQILPDYNYGQYGCDLPITLLQDALKAMQQALPDPDFILYSGDMSGHHLPTAESRFTAINDTIFMINEAYPGVPIYPTLGNNDCYPDYWLNYWPNRANDWLKKIWSSWSLYSGIPDDQEENFTHAGYYVVQHTENLYIIVLNSIYVCGGHNPDWDADKRTDPAGQFAWLNSTLQGIQNSGATAYIVGHLPPNQYWHHDYVYSYNDIIKQFQNVISGQFFGHTHRDELHVITDQEIETPFGFWLQTPSLTPKDSNNPGFRVVNYNTTTYALTDYIQYYSGLLKTQREGFVSWFEEYRFSSTYGLHNGKIDTQAVQNAITKIFNDPWMYYTWKGNYACQYETPDEKLQYYCEMEYPQIDDQELCLTRGIYQKPTIQDIQPAIQDIV